MSTLEIQGYLDYLQAQRGLREKSLIAYEKDLIKFRTYLEQENLSFNSLKRYEMRGFLAELKHNKLSNTSINRILSAVKGYMKYRIRLGDTDTAGILEIDTLKTAHHLPRFLFEKEVDTLIDFPCELKEDYRDRAIFELLFSSGLRVSELVSLDSKQFIKLVDQLRIIGKGGKERIIFFGKKCFDSIQRYLEIRNQFFNKKTSGIETALFINNKGTRLTQRGVRYILDKRIKQIGLEKKISPHALRHSFATCMVRNGADIRAVQLLLGHESLQTTQIYTHLDLDVLKDIHAKYHPHAKK